MHTRSRPRKFVRKQQRGVSKKIGGFKKKEEKKKSQVGSAGVSSRIMTSTGGRDYNREFREWGWRRRGGRFASRPPAGR